MPVKTWGDFEIDLDRLLGKGGMGAVYMGRQISLDRPAAIKVLKSDLTSNPEFVKRFNREAALLARIVDNHVVQIFGAGEADGQHYYAMEYVEGEDYASKVRKGHQFSMDEVLKVGESVGIALQMAWRHRIIHRDIKPSNILLTKDNETKVMDFGLAKNPESDLTLSEVIMGTAKYMSPEQATGGQCDIRSDLYSLGIVLYEFAVGQPPFTGEGATAIMYQQVHKEPVPPRQLKPEIPPEIERLILRLIAKDPAKRHPTPEALLSDIRGIREGIGPEERDTLFAETIVKEKPSDKTAVTTNTPPAKPKGNGVLIGAVALLVAAGIGYFAYTSTTTTPEKKTPTPPDTSEKKTTPPEVAVKKEDPPPPPPPPPPTKEPEKPVNNPPPSKTDPWAEARRKGLEAFERGDWTLAATSLRDAERQGATDVHPKTLQAEANVELSKGDKAATDGDDAAAVLHYEAALNITKDDDALKSKIKSAKYQLHRKSAEKNEGHDWSKAAEEWKRALEIAPEPEAEEARARQKYCSIFADAVSAMLQQEWSRAQGLWQELAKNPRGQAPEIGAGLKKSGEELAKMKAAEAEKLKAEFESLVRSAQDLRKQARWAEAKSRFEEALQPRFQDFPKTDITPAMEEVMLGLKPPPGMIYVPGGKFPMGGGRAVESPAGEASVVPIYMDEREVRVADYVEFLKALDTFGHTPACPKQEPPNKKHTPLDWDTQKPEDAVVGVDWWDAASYAAWRKKRLPTEPEWEHAAGFDPSGRRLYPWGNKYQKEQGKSYLGFDGMSSGVIEWTADWLNRYPWSKAEHSDFGEKRRVVRGGVLLAEDAPEATKVTYRYWYLPMYRSRKLGFRCVQDMPEK